MAEERHYQAVVRLGALGTDAEARLKAALIEKAANQIGAGPVDVVALEVASTTWASVLGCEVCGSVVCQGRSAHTAAHPSVLAEAPTVVKPEWAYGESEPPPASLGPDAARPGRETPRVHLGGLSEADFPGQDI